MIPLRDIMANALAPSQTEAPKSPKSHDLSPESMVYSGMERIGRFSALETLADILSTVRIGTLLLGSAPLGLILSAIVAFS